MLKKLLGMVVLYSFGSFTNASNRTKNQRFIAGPREIAQPSHAIPLPDGKGVSQCLRIPEIQTKSDEFFVQSFIMIYIKLLTCFWLYLGKHPL